MRTKPRFLLTGSVDLTIQRNTQKGGYVDGRWAEGKYSPVTQKVNIQPMQYHQTLLLPESERSKQWFVLYSACELRASQEGQNGWDADRFEWEGHTYEIMKARRWQMGVLDHWEAQAVRVPVTPG